MRSLFYSGPFSQYCVGRSSYWLKTPDSRNWLTLLAAESMTCSCSSNIALLRSKVTNLSFVDQELSNGVFISARGHLQRNLGSRLTKLTVVFQCDCANSWNQSISATEMFRRIRHQFNGKQHDNRLHRDPTEIENAKCHFVAGGTRQHRYYGFPITCSQGVEFLIHTFWT